ncbi:MAG: YggS family pyridoxal phosphate-dependent enzyme [Lachnospiraceae bacterium]|nr:YggS family pyridoxal phosphate-dependent enzyme [Lachnospiraceae bacterium]
MITENIKKIHENIEASCIKANRDPSEVELIAISKTKPISDIKLAYEAGERSFGENKVQDFCTKYPDLPEDIKWHLVGHLQRNKVKKIIGHVALIHSVDNYRLAEEINIQSKKAEIVTPILIEVNIAGEESKSGISINEAEEIIREIAPLDGIQIKGLMTVAPNLPNSEDTRPYFNKMHQLFIDIKNENIDNVLMDTLSMGMTNDYKIAIEEGSTMIRVGTAIFGSRNYNI